MSILTLILLSIIQGLTEFLPISSSGHLALIEHLVKFSETQRMTYTAFLHLGTTLALIIFFAQRIGEIFKFTFQKQDKQRQKENISLIVAIIIGTFPIAIIGLITKNSIDLLFKNPIYALFFLIVTGCILFLTRFAKEKKTKTNYLDALLIGIAQAIALLPGISRSGLTISIALFLGIAREESFEFSFLLSIPAVIGANILVLKDITTNLALIPFSVTIIFSCISGIIALSILRKIVIKKQIHKFAYYCWILGCAGLILMFILK
ncbi:MAG: undecaprenyl-diphosphate phosphatase [candidate division WOR-3 bacterium]|nr:undecaprenyl-diphosphate phosphatase [candidate division WOR-3 bacterium]